MKILMAGLGSAGQRHLRNLQRLVPDAEFLAWRRRGVNLIIDDRQRATTGRPEEAYGLRVFADLERALEERPDLIVVANPISMHCATALSAVTAGCAPFIEKPLADRWEGVPELLDRASTARVPMTVGYQMRCHPALQRVERLLRDGGLGAPVSARLHFGEYLPGMHPYEDYRTSHAARRREGGGVLLCLSHELDIAQWLFGAPERVYAAGGHLSSLEVDVEDTALLVMDCRWGGRRLPVSVSLDFVQRPPQRHGEIVCEGGTIRWNVIEGSMAWFDADRGEWQDERFPNFERNQMFIDEMSAFLCTMRGDGAPVVTAASAAQTLLTAVAAQQSLAAGRAVDVPAAPLMAVPRG